MADVSAASVAVGNAMAGMMTSVGQSSLRRVVSGADATVHNIIDSVVTPVTRRVVKSRGCQYRNNSALGATPVLTTQQLQAAKTSLDRRIGNIQRDVVNLLTRACQTSDLLNKEHPTFEGGSLHLRLTIPVPQNTPIEGFTRVEVQKQAPGPPSPSGGQAAARDIPSTGDSSEWGEGDPDDDFGFSCMHDEPGDASPFWPPASTPPPAGAGVFTPLVAHWARPDGHRFVDAVADRLKDQPESKSQRFSRFKNAVSKQLGKMGPSSLCQKVSSTAHKVCNAANPFGARDLYVLDVTIPTEAYTFCVETADKLVGEDKAARNVQIASCIRKLRRLISGKVHHGAYVYLETVVTLVTLALFLDVGDTGKNHCMPIGMSGEQALYEDYFAKKELEPAMDDLKAAKEDAGLHDEELVWAVPAPEVKGSLNETLVMYETEKLDEYELKEKKPVLGAVHVGVDLFGKPAPNDHTNPLSYVSAVYRHLGDSDTAVAEGTPHEYVIHLDRSERAQMSDAHTKVWNDMISDHLEDFEALLKDPTQRFDYDFLEDGKPSSYTRESYMEFLEKQMTDETLYANDDAMLELLSHVPDYSSHVQKLRASAACKKGEDSSRARFVITPGQMGSEGLHQARTSPMIRALETLHAVKYNHTNLKGLTEETKRIRFAEFLKAVPKGGIVFGTDKSKNDACFRDPVWKKCCEYLAKMNMAFHEHVTTTAYVYSPDEDKRREAFPNGKVDAKYWVVQMTPLTAILLSGIGPTSFFNRLESTTEKGVAVLLIEGEEAYEKWRASNRVAKPSEHPAWELHEQPHVSEYVDWEPLAPSMVTDTSIKVADLKEEQIITPHMGSNEGDDQSHAIIPPKAEGWAGLSVRDIIMKYTSVLSSGTGFIFEAALAADDLDMVGRNSVFEMLSAWIGLPHGKVDAYEVAVIVPKVLKALRKLPHCTISSAHNVTRDPDGVPTDVQRDANFWCLALTKYYTLAVINHESLGVRGFFLAHGDYCYEKLMGLIGKQKAYTHATIYGDRDPEKRGLEEAKCTTFPQCGALKEHAHELCAKVRVDRVLRVCCTAWRSDLPELARLPKEEVAASLQQLDAITMGLTLSDSMIKDPMVLWEILSDAGCVSDALVKQATVSHYKTAAMYRSPKVLADAEETVKLARELARTKPKGSANKGGGSEKAAKKGSAEQKGRGKGKGSAQTDGTASHPSGKGKGKAKAKGKGKGSDKDGTGKSQPKGESPKAEASQPAESTKSQSGKWFPKPSWGKNSSNDSWWRKDASQKSGGR